MKAKIIALALISMFLLGCPKEPISIEPEKEYFDFTLGEPFTVKPNVIYKEEKVANLRLNVVSFADSRCQEGVQCVWEGEQGVTLMLSYPQDALKQEERLKNEPSDQQNDNSVSAKNQSMPLILSYKEIYLGEKTKTSESIFGFEVGLISIDADKNEAVLRITKKTETPGSAENLQWFSFAPKQCNSNEWDEWVRKVKWEPNPEKLKAGKNGLGINTEELRISDWLEYEHNIKIHGYASKKTSDIVCMACSCPRGDLVAVQVSPKDAAAMQALVWKNTGQIACTLDLRVCPDGTFAGRQAPFCEFTECPESVIDVSE